MIDLIDIKFVIFEYYCKEKCYLPQEPFMLTLGEIQNSAHDPSLLTCPSEQQTPFKSTWLFAHLQTPASLLGLVGGQKSLHSPFRLTSPSLQQISSSFTWPNPHPQTPLTLIGLAGGHVSLQIPLSLTWPSEQQMPPI